MEFITNILKVADVNSEDLSHGIIQFLGGFVYYEDTILSEDIYSVADARESDHFEKLTWLEQEILNRIHQETAEAGCAYVRVVYERKEQLTPKIDITDVPLPGESDSIRRNFKASGLKLIHPKDL